MQQLGEIKNGEGEEPTVVKYFKHFMQQKNEWTENINSPNMNMCHRKYRSVYKKERLNIQPLAKYYVFNKTNIKTKQN